MINGLDMNICTESPKLNMCMACKKVSETNHYIVAEKTIITLCTDCLEKLCIKGIERCGYIENHKRILINRGNEKVYIKRKEK